jgi:DnaJ-class molecular chaperone
MEIKLIICPNCNGTGVVLCVDDPWSKDSWTYYADCKTCGGTGKVLSKENNE